MQFLPTDFLTGKEVQLILDHTDAGDPEKNWVPAYHFAICDLKGTRMGVCDLRIGYTEGLYFGGHIGYSIDPEFRGHHYAAQACELLFLLAAKHHMPYLIISCNPDNWPSRKTCEYLHGELLEIAELPEDNDMRKEAGETHKCIFKFVL